jgi:hypothetical protein
MAVEQGMHDMPAESRERISGMGAFRGLEGSRRKQFQTAGWYKGANMTKAGKDNAQDKAGQASSNLAGGEGFGSGSPLQRWSNICFLPSTRLIVTKAQGLQLEDGWPLILQQPAVDGV